MVFISVLVIEGTFDLLPHLNLSWMCSSTKQGEREERTHLYHELALRWISVGHRQRIRDLPGKHLVLDVGGRYGRGLQQHHAVIVIILRVAAVI